MNTYEKLSSFYGPFLIARHTEVLVEYNSPHAEDISRALKALDGYWTEAKIETFAEKAVDAAEDYPGRSVAHAADKAEEDNPANDVPVKQLHESKAKMNTGISSGVQNLEQIPEEYLLNLSRVRSPKSASCILLRSGASERVLIRRIPARRAPKAQAAAFFEA